MQIFRVKPIDDVGPTSAPATGSSACWARAISFMLAIGAVIGAGIFGAIGTAAAGQVLPNGEVVRYGAGPALDSLVRAARRGLRARGALLRRTGVDDSASGQRLRLCVRDARRTRRLDHRLGSDPRVRRRQRGRGDLVGRLLQDVARWRGRHAAGLADDRLSDGAPQLQSRGARPARHGAARAGRADARQSCRRPASSWASRGCCCAARARARGPTPSWSSSSSSRWLLFIGVGLANLHPEYYTPFAPNGFTGIHQGAAIVFFAYIGFDAISTAAEETIDPQRNLPRGILGGLAICTFIYVVVGAVLTGLVPWQELGVADPLADALDARRVHERRAGSSRSAPSSRWPPCCWCSSTASRGSSSTWRAMGCCRPGRHAWTPRRAMPYGATVVTGLVVAGASAIGDAAETYDLTNIGTLFAFAIVCIGVLVLRVQRARPAPAVPGAVRVGRRAARRGGVRVDDAGPAPRRPGRGSCGGWRSDSRLYFAYGYRRSGCAGPRLREIVRGYGPVNRPAEACAPWLMTGSPFGARACTTCAALTSICRAIALSSLPG